jgi:arylsulfatase A-like enzyme
MKKPTGIIVICTDDHGWGDLSCMGSPYIKTPHLDRLAGDGIRFTHCYANSAVCSPSRAGLMTGRYPARAGVRSILAGHRTASGMPNTVPTLASIFRDAGWATGWSGKWHLGLREGCRPQDHGFERCFGFLAGCVDYYSHIFYWGMNVPGPAINPVHDLWREGREEWKCGRYLTEMITEEAIASIRDAVGQERPFFQYVAYNAPHYPMHAPAKYHERFAHLPWEKRIMAAMISALDDGVGEIRAELDRLGVAEDTLIFFTSDNGPSRESRNWLDGTLTPYFGGSAGRFRGGKTSLFDGGICVPGMMCWPSGLEGGRVIDEPIVGCDIAPTVMAAVGLQPDPEMDGIDLLPGLTGASPWAERDIFWEFKDQTAMRRGPWKLVLQGRVAEDENPIEPVWLSNLADDPGETCNLAETEPERCAQMQACATRWREQIEHEWEQGFSPLAQGLTGRTDQADA